MNTSLKTCMAPYLAFLALLTLANLTPDGPDGHEVIIIDENIDKIDFWSAYIGNSANNTNAHSGAAGSNDLLSDQIRTQKVILINYKAYVRMIFNVVICEGTDQLNGLACLN